MKDKRAVDVKKNNTYNGKKNTLKQASKSTHYARKI